jgi:hypothetical protein
MNDGTNSPLANGLRRFFFVLLRKSKKAKIYRGNTDGIRLSTASVLERRRRREKEASIYHNSREKKNRCL